MPSEGQNTTYKVSLPKMESAKKQASGGLTTNLQQIPKAGEHVKATIEMHKSKLRQWETHVINGMNFSKINFKE